MQLEVLAVGKAAVLATENTENTEGGHEMEK
jgi:hypothetical protein